MSRHRATWINGTKTITGEWEYYPHSDRFVVWLNKKDRDTGTYKSMVLAGDTPEWGNWKLVRENNNGFEIPQHLQHLLAYALIIQERMDKIKSHQTGERDGD